LRSSTLLPHYGLVVALGGAPIELVVATDMSLQFMQVAESLRYPVTSGSAPPQMEGPPYFLFRVYEKVALRIRESAAIVALVPSGGGGHTGSTGATGHTGSAQPYRNRTRGPSK